MTKTFFTLSVFRLQTNIIYHVSETISGHFVVSARNCPASMSDNIALQMKKAFSNILVPFLPVFPLMFEGMINCWFEFL